MSELKRKKPSVLLVFLRAGISLCIIGGAVAVATWFAQNPAHTKKATEHVVRKVYVTTEAISFGNYPIEINVMGKVAPAREMALKAQVSGEVIEVSKQFIPGGFFQAGEDILKIDQADYALDVKSKRSAYNQAQAAYQLEEGQQQIAKNEIEILQRNTGKTLKSTDLALRKPQLAQAKANLDGAKAALDITLLNLERTTLKAPFDAIVIERSTDLGNVIAAQNQLATLVATDEYWINIDVPLSDLPWLKVPGTKALVQLGDMRGTRVGKVFKQTGSVDEQSRLAGIIVSVSDPLLLGGTNDRNASPLILDDYVPVKLIGKSLSGAARLPQEYVRKTSEGDVVWLEQGERLVIQNVRVAYKDRNYAYITQGLDYAKNLITSNIVTPVAGMDIVVQNNGGEH